MRTFFGRTGYILCLLVFTGASLDYINNEDEIKTILFLCMAIGGMQISSRLIDDDPNKLEKDEMKNAAWLVTETYEHGFHMNKPEVWVIEPVSARDEVGSSIFFCDGKVVGMPLGMKPTDPIEKDENIIFILEPDGKTDGNEEFTWAAFSTKEKAKAWIASRKAQ